MYEYIAIVEYFDKNKAQRTQKKVILAKNKKMAEKKLQTLGDIINIKWEKKPDIAADLQLELFTKE